MRRVARQLVASRVRDDQLHAVLRRVLHPGCSHGMVEVGLAPIRNITSAFCTSFTWFDTAPELMPSISAATDEAWQRRVQWSTLLVPKPVRTSFWKRKASSLEPL